MRVYPSSSVMINDSRRICGTAAAIESAYCLQSLQQSSGDRPTLMLYVCKISLTETFDRLFEL